MQDIQIFCKAISMQNMKSPIFEVLGTWGRIYRPLQRNASVWPLRYICTALNPTGTVYVNEWMNEPLPLYANFYL